MGNGTRGFGTGELKSYGYQGPPALTKGSSVSSNMMGHGGPIRGVDLGYDSMSQGYNRGGKGGQYNAGSSGVGKYDNYNQNDFNVGGGQSKESTAYTNSNYRKPFNPNNMQTPSSTSTMSPGIQSNNGGGYRNSSQHQQSTYNKPPSG
jgi:hypothetical protein